MKRASGQLSFSSGCWLALVFWFGSSEGQTDLSRCQYMVDNSSTVYGVCQKVVTAPSNVRACYWFQTEHHSERSIPYVGQMQVVPTPDVHSRGVQGYTAVCSFSRKLEDMADHVDPNFRVSFSPGFAAQYDAGRLLVRTDAGAETPAARKMEQDSAVHDGAAGKADEESPFSSPAVLAVVGCVATVALALIVVNAVIVIRRKRKDQTESEQQQPQDPLWQLLSPCAIALRHSDYPSNIFGVRNATFNDADTTAATSAATSTSSSIPPAAEATAEHAARRSPASSSSVSAPSPPRAVRFEEVPESRETQLPVPRVCSLAARDDEGPAAGGVCGDGLGEEEGVPAGSPTTGSQAVDVAKSAGSHGEDDTIITKTESGVLY